MRSSFLLLLFAVAGAGAIATACSDGGGGGSGGDPTADGGETNSTSSSSSGGGEPSSGGDSCNALTQLGASFDILSTQAKRPAALGGTIPDGLYVMTSGKVWEATTPEGEKWATAGGVTMEVKGDTVQTIATSPSSGDVTRRSGTFVTNDTDKSIAFMPTCVSPPRTSGSTLVNGPYTVDGTTLRFFTLLSSGVFMELVYTKQ